jgi:hypothetical protein
MTEDTWGKCTTEEWAARGIFFTPHQIPPRLRSVCCVGTGMHAQAHTSRQLERRFLLETKAMCHLPEERELETLKPGRCSYTQKGASPFCASLSPFVFDPFWPKRVRSGSLHQTMMASRHGLVGLWVGAGLQRVVSRGLFGSAALRNAAPKSGANSGARAGSEAPAAAPAGGGDASVKAERPKRKPKQKMPPLASPPPPPKTIIAAHVIERLPVIIPDPEPW